MLSLYPLLISFEIDRGVGRRATEVQRGLPARDGCLHGPLEQSISKSRSNPQG